MQVHLDLVGGLAGDMFIAALLDAFPDCEGLVVEAIALLSDSDVRCGLSASRDDVLQGRTFRVQKSQPETASISLGLAIHQHVNWRSLRARFENSALSLSVRRHAVAIFGLLADAEAHVHGVQPETVEFHEVGAWDSIADVVGAAVLIDALGVTRWTCSAVPLGMGRVKTAHGILPVPAPATTRLLLGMSTIDDGIAGERVTPTGAAILRYLCPPTAAPVSGLVAVPSPARILTASGVGFGTRVLPGISNHLRVLCFDESVRQFGDARQLDVLEFEIDDQSGEDLATGVERLRAHAAVLDVTQAPVFGKKGRMMTHVRVLARLGHLASVTEACFRETTTIGLRHRTVDGIGLVRTSEDVSIDGLVLRVKVVDRPGGRTAKTEADDVLTQQAHAKRASLRARAEFAALCDNTPQRRDDTADLDA